MRKISMNLRNASALAGLFALVVAGCAPKEAPEEAVVTINGEAIPMKEYYSRLEKKTRVTVSGGPQGPQQASVVGTLGSQMMQDLINERILLQLAKEDNLIPSDADVQAEIDFQKKTNPKLEASLTEQGMSMDDFKRQIKLALIPQLLVGKGVVVTAPQVDEYIKQNKASFRDPERATMLWVVANDPKKKALIDKDLKAGKDFRTVALQYTDEPQAAQNGAVFPSENVEGLPPEFQTAIRATAENKATNWIPYGNSSIKLFVQKKTPAKDWEITPDIKKRVQRELAAQRGGMTSNFQKRLMDKLKNAKIDVGPQHLRDPWEKQFTEIKKQIAQQEEALRNAPPMGGMPGGAPAPGGAPTTPPAGGGTPAPATTGK
jgi:foldase protein PrsA